MINLYLTNREILLYDVDDWAVLRKNYRIIGEIVGDSLHTPSLPVKILPEEACLLLSKNIVNVLEASEEIIKTKNDQNRLDEYETTLLSAQIVEYQETRKVQIEKIVDRIMAKPNENRSREEIIEDQLKRTPSVTKENMIWPVQLCTSNTTNKKTVTISDILKITSKLKSEIYSDLWERGYYITQGHKFGGDFLVYNGEPICHHAVFIIKCVECEENISPLEVIAFGRLGTSVKKRAVLASLTDSKVSYITINWIDS
ncbi:tRNA-splicing endonuclease subunit Sen34 [Diorhabda carinulata]|uniref:tRNA-splicing endonuclease subunit Sen34 n=1 Tax=Diorhabda carinulata TaxID=1163345 RepID=UPI0025A074FD|nr:tRNA-splicing endonuclease subunit Sen34 [Diorhabda carinulata]